jgi:hypothetical protein
MSGRPRLGGGVGAAGETGEDREGMDVYWEEAQATEGMERVRRKSGLERGEN